MSRDPIFVTVSGHAQDSLDRHISNIGILLGCSVIRLPILHRDSVTVIKYFI